MVVLGKGGVLGCSLCTKTLTHSGDLTRHIRTHNNDHPFGCSLCPKTFTQRGSLTTHMRTQHAGGLR
ncbi:hypothetical protein T484DRAFT_1808566 [Baffinella frigidus]|nr:hypothetical protein T484DRAFT_1808566 [Cryptophyta sp. CCMP2293]